MKEVVKWLKEIAYLLYVADFRKKVGCHYGNTYNYTPASKSEYLKGVK